MDVRCEKCQTEYELDESKLKPGGVTVKCTTCGHMFKVRRRHPTAVSTPAPPVAGGPSRASTVLDAEDGDRTWLVRLEDGEIKTCRELSTLQKWIVSGRVTRECSISRTGKKWKLLGDIGELASFFAIADEAREARASGKLTGTVTQEYPAAPPVEAGGPAHPRTVPRRSSSAGAQEPAAPGTLLDPPSGAVGGGGAVGAGPQPPFSQTLPLGTVPVALRSGGSSAPVSPAALHASDDAPTISSPEESAALARAAEAAEGAYRAGAVPREPDHIGTAPPPSRPVAGSPPQAGPAAGVPRYEGSSGRSGPMAAAGVPRYEGSSGRSGPMAAAGGALGAPSGPKTAGWAAQGRVGAALSGGDSGPTGPVGGLARGAPVSDAAFVAGGEGAPRRMPEIRGEFENGRFVPTDLGDDDEPLLPPRSRAGLWIALVSLVLLGGAAAAFYFLVIRPGDGAAPVAAAADAGQAQALAPSDAAAAPGVSPALLSTVPALLAADVRAGLEELDRELEAAIAAGATDPAALVARARVLAALAQQDLDASQLAAAPAEGARLLAASREKAAAARALADKALAAEGDDAPALLALADARRLEGERTIEVERLLRQASQTPLAPELAREAELVQALLHVRDERLRDARVLLDKIAGASPSGDVRARLRLAWLDHLDGNKAPAVKSAEAVLAAQAEHEGARALLARLGAGEEETPEKPEKVEEPAAGGRTAPERASGGGGGGGKPARKEEPAEDSLDATLARANKAAESGNCKQAMSLFRKVLDANPASVEALTGLGYCHLDRKEYESARTRFRAALGISSRYQPAMWGIAEAYQQQGLKQEAIERYRRFLEEHPGSPRAGAARRQIQRLGGGASPGGAQPETGSGSGPAPGSEAETGSEPAGGDDEI